MINCHLTRGWEHPRSCTINIDAFNNCRMAWWNVGWPDNTRWITTASINWCKLNTRRPLKSREDLTTTRPKGRPASTDWRSIGVHIKYDEWVAGSHRSLWRGREAVAIMPISIYRLLFAVLLRLNHWLYDTSDTTPATALEETIGWAEVLSGGGNIDD